MPSHGNAFCVTSLLCGKQWDTAGFPSQRINTLRSRQNGRPFADDIIKYIFLNENVWIPIKISLKFVPKGRINNIPALVQIMAWRRPGDKPLSEPMMVSLPTHICVTRPQWVNDAELEFWCFLWFMPEQTAERTVGTPVIRDAMAFMWF